VEHSQSAPAVGGVLELGNAVLLRQEVRPRHRECAREKRPLFIGKALGYVRARTYKRIYFRKGVFLRLNDYMFASQESERGTPTIL